MYSQVFKSLLTVETPCPAQIYANTKLFIQTATISYNW